jgi:ribosome-associated protein
MNRRALVAAIEENVHVSFARSGGPGGQNVNRRATKADARLTVASLDILTEEQKARVRSRLATRINGRDEIVVQVSDERQQLANRKVAVQRIASLLEAAVRVPRKRRPTRPTASARAGRLDEKRRRGAAKRTRRSAAGEDE